MQQYEYSHIWAITQQIIIVFGWHELEVVVSNLCQPFFFCILIYSVLISQCQNKKQGGSNAISPPAFCETRP